MRLWLALQYASEQGAASVVGVDLSQKMLQTARERNTAPNITYLCQAIEEVDFPKESFDIVISSLALHYVASFEETARRVYALLKPGGTFVFSAEHPVFTAYGSQDWY